MTTKAFDLPLILPLSAECGGCVDELAAELASLRGVSDVEPDVTRGLLHVSFAPEMIAVEELARDARRIGAQSHCVDHCPFENHDHAAGGLALLLPSEQGYQQRLAHLTGLDCADCALKLEGALQHGEGVIDAAVSFGAATLKVTFDPRSVTFDELLERVHRLGYDSLERGRGGASGQRPPAPPPVWRQPRALTTMLSGVAVVAAFAAQVLAPAAAPILFAVAMALGGWSVARAAFYSLRARSVDINVLMTLAAIGAAAIGQWSEAALVMFLFALGNLLQALTMERTRRAVKALVALEPTEATLLRDGAELTIPVEAVAPDDVLLVRPGERVPVDGLVISGVATLDQSAITGELLAVGAHEGVDVFAGSIVQGGSLQIRAVTTAADNTIARIIHLVEEAQSERAPLQSSVDRFAAKYTPVVIVGAALVALVPPLFFGQPFVTWFYRALALLIISCPCALVISTPVSILAALGAASRRGILIKGGVYLEEAHRLRAMAFDKTGTLTLGRPAVTDVIALDAGSDDDEARDRVLSVAAAVERLSEHPLAGAIVAVAEEAGLTVAASSCGDDCSCAGADGGDDVATAGPTRFRALTGAGVRADIDGVTYLVGKPGLFTNGDNGIDGSLAEQIERLEAQGKTVVVVGVPGRPLGLIAVADTLRPAAREALAAVRTHGIERLVLLTGDNDATARAVGAQAGVDEVRSGLLPEQKVAAVRELHERYGSVAMIGDGVNDSPALAAADLGFAMGAAGTDAALDTADIALMGDDLSAIADTLTLSRRTTAVIWENIAFSIAVKAVFLVLAPLGLVTLWMAVFADMGTALLVIANGMRLRGAIDHPR